MVTVEQAAKVNDHLAKKFEGGLFINYYMSSFCCDNFYIHKDYYTVLNGKVYIIEGLNLHDSGDTLLSIASDCKRIGKYNPKKEYNRVMKTYTYKQFKKLHKI